MPSITTEERIVRLVKASEAAGRTVYRVIVEGKRVELVYTKDQGDRDDFDMVDYGKQ